MKSRRNLAITGMVLAVVLAFSSCSSASRDEAYETYIKAGYSDGGIYANESLEEKSEDSAENSVTTNRKLVKNVTYEIETEQFDETVQSIRAKTESLGGYIEASQVENSTGRYQYCRSGAFTIRIPADRLDDFCEIAKDFGNITDITESVDDVTLDYSDVSGKVKALETKRDNLISMLSKAETVSEMLEIQEYLSTCEEELENYKSRLLLLDNMVDYSTVRLNIQEVQTYTEPEPETLGEKIAQEFKESWAETLEFLEGLAIGIIGNIPGILTAFLILGLIAAAVVLIVKKAIKKKNPKEKAPDIQENKEEK